MPLFGPYACPYCAASHEGRCPLVKAIEYFENGTIKRVEYVTAADHIAANPLQKVVADNLMGVQRAKT